MRKIDNMTMVELIAYESELCEKGKLNDAQAVRWAIRNMMVERKRKDGTLHWLADAGYSGRNSNRR